jgi:hypothetical protein
VKDEIRNLVGAAGCLVALAACELTQTAPTNARAPKVGEASASILSYLDVTYIVDDESVILVDGRAEHSAAPGSAIQIRTSILERSPRYSDLDGDGDEDVALVLVQDLGGSGTLSYLVVAVQANGRYVGTDAVFLGDRIDSVYLTAHGGLIDVRFRDRATDASFADAPLESRMVRARLAGFQLDEVSHY